MAALARRSRQPTTHFDVFAVPTLSHCPVTLLGSTCHWHFGRFSQVSPESRVPLAVRPGSRTSECRTNRYYAQNRDHCKQEMRRTATRGGQLWHEGRADGPSSLPGRWPLPQWPVNGLLKTTPGRLELDRGDGAPQWMLLHSPYPNRPQGSSPQESASTNDVPHCNPGAKPLSRQSARHSLKNDRRPACEALRNGKSGPRASIFLEYSAGTGGQRRPLSLTDPERLPIIGNDRRTRLNASDWTDPC